MVGKDNTVAAASCGEIPITETIHPIICVVLLKPCDIQVLKVLLKS